MKAKFPTLWLSLESGICNVESGIPKRREAGQEAVIVSSESGIFNAESRYA